MLLSIKSMNNYSIEAKDGGIGHVYTFLFDDRQWTVRYMVVDTGNWLPGRKVLIAPESIGKPQGEVQIFPIELTRQQIKDSPDIDTERPVSRQMEIELHRYYDWTPYWGRPFGPIAMPYAPPAAAIESGRTAQQAVAEPGQGLRSTREVLGYDVQAVDGRIGSVDDFIVNVQEWLVRYIVVDTRKWLTGRKVIIPPDWVTDIDWASSEVRVDVAADTVRDSPEFEPQAAVNREYEIRLYDYYGRPRYWM
ncbi:MAG: PRC-barrel domain-containing protein [Planctomycetaceae bacterium]|nr:PRC-barrel domain-containing protein [Planctomycetaceae bacterium]